ncbi:MAG: hypothetical protein MZV49_23640 [Rhodopseudomonas palustris]|nr:hypothetical protein [Rhodopseudomonas palustris]
MRAVLIGLHRDDQTRCVNREPARNRFGLHDGHRAFLRAGGLLPASAGRTPAQGEGG